MLERLLHRFGLSGREADRGATAILVAGSLLMLMGFAAIAVDVARGFVERRVDQTAADMAATAAGVEFQLGVFEGGTTGDDMVQAALDFARVNLPTQYSDSEWQALWQGCTDPNRNEQPGDNFVALSAPSGWTVADPANWCMSIDSGKSLFRVRVPDQAVDATFGRLLGVTQLRPSAAAVVNLDTEGAGILPFGIPSGIPDGVQHCLSEPPAGLSNDPCEGPSSGNFGVLKARIFGDSPYTGCNAAPTNAVLAYNVAGGIDHLVVPSKEPGDSEFVEVRDQCFNFPVNTLNTDTGFPQGVEWGLATGNGLPASRTALLQQGPQAKQVVVDHSLDDAPLWNWLLPASQVAYGTDAPALCNPAGFPPDPDDGSGWEQMQQCLSDYANNGYSAVIFDGDLGDRSSGDWSPRFGYAPQFHQNSLGSGNSWLNVERFRAIFIQGTWWKKGNTWVVHRPGEACENDDGMTVDCNDGGNYSLKQVTSFLIPDPALPPELRGDPPGDVLGINPFTLRLIR